MQLCHCWRSLAITAVAIAMTACEADRPAMPVSESGAPLPQVRLAIAEQTRVDRAVSATGTLAADEQVVLGTKVAGRVSEITVDLGSRVRKGQAIARIDPRDYRLQVQQAEAALQQARVRLGLRPEGTDDHVNPADTALVRQAAAVLKEARLTHERMAQLWKRNMIARAELDTAFCWACRGNPG
jgi:multidrug efflux pump subunit AcrA (membrane-fusion protein)